MNAERRGALRDHRSKLYVRIDRVKKLLQQAFPWAQVHYLAESVASMDEADRWRMSISFGDQPWLIDASGVSMARRPRLYWCSWELIPGRGVAITPPVDNAPHSPGKVELEASLKPSDYITPGWSKGDDQKLEVAYLYHLTSTLPSG